MKTVRLFCDWQDSATLTENVLKDFRSTLQISKENVYKDVKFTDNNVHFSIGIHLNRLNNVGLLSSACNKHVIVSFEPPELLDSSLTNGDIFVNKYFIPELKYANPDQHTMLHPDKYIYHPTLWTLHADVEHSNILPSNKTNKISCIISTKSITQTHRRRREIVSNIYHNIKDLEYNGMFGFYGEDYRNRISKKHVGLRDYSYSIAFENSVERGVLTEKFYDCIVNNCIPITNNKTAFELFPEDAFVYVDFSQTNNQIFEQIKELLNKPITEKQDKANQQAKTEILYGKRNPVDEIYEIVKKVIDSD